MNFVGKLKNAFGFVTSDARNEDQGSMNQSYITQADEKGIPAAISIQAAQNVKVPVSTIDATQAVWGKSGRYLVIVG